MRAAPLPDRADAGTDPALPVSGLAGLRIGLLTASASRLGGGVFEAVVAQAALIRAAGGEATVFALDDVHGREDEARLAAEVARFRVVGPKQVGFAPPLIEALLEARLDCLHLHGIWMYPSRAGSAWAARTGRPYIISPHGMLAPWITARGRAKKVIARAVYERSSWRRASVLHALTAAEAQDIADEAGRRDAWVIPNAAPPVQQLRPMPDRAEFLYIGRIHLKKNLSALLEAWQRSADAVMRRRARLTIAGWGEPDEVAALRAAVVRAGETVRFVGPAFGAEKAALLESASFVVLPSLSEGLPMSILEAWAHALPTLMTRECHLVEGFARGAALECTVDAAGIAATLQRALALDAGAWAAMSRAARDLASGPFSPGTIAGQWIECYRAAINGMPRWATA